jgi:hypothetical protein
MALQLIKTWLAELHGWPADQAWPGSNEHGLVITLDGDVGLSIAPSINGETWLLASCPGHAPVADGGAEPGWYEAPDPVLPGASDGVLIGHADGLTMLVRSVPRAALDRERLRIELRHCLKRHREWQSAAQA